MKLFRLPSLALSLLLQLLPVLRVATADAALVVSPVMAVLRLIAGATAMAGSYHAVSGASVTLNNPAGGKVLATNGVANAFRVQMTYSDGGGNVSPAVYDAKNLPPGFNQPTKSGSIWRITGTPTQTGVFTTVKVTGYEKADKTGDHKFTSTITITVVDAVPQITTQPVQSVTAAAGTGVTLTVAASGGSLVYQWLKDDLELPQATSSTLTLDPLKLTDAGSYRVRVQNSGGVVLSDPAVLTVTPATTPPPPAFTAVPEGATVHEGEPVTLSAAATGEGPLIFAWFKDATPLPGDTASFLIPAVTSADVGAYSVRVTGTGGSTNSPPAVVTMVAPLAFGAAKMDAQTGGPRLLLPFNGIPGRSYVLESAAQLSAPLSAWENLQETTATETSFFSVDFLGVETRVFRTRTK